MKHTFALCAYRESAYLEECILSLRRQTIPSRVVVCTSTPNDWIFSVAERYNLPVFVNEEASGIASDWNFAFRSVETDFVTLAHQDDVYEPGYLAGMLDAMERSRQPVIGFSDYYELRNGSRVYASRSRLLRIKELMLIPLRGPAGRGSIPVRRCILSIGNAICCPSVTYNRAVIGEAPFRSEFTCDLDWDAWERLSKLEGDFCYVPLLLMGHRIHADSATTAMIGDSHGRSCEDLEMYRRFWPRPVAAFLNSLYAGAQNSNTVQ